MWKLKEQIIKKDHIGNGDIESATELGFLWFLSS